MSTEGEPGYRHELHHAVTGNVTYPAGPKRPANRKPPGQGVQVRRLNDDPNVYKSSA